MQHKDRVQKPILILLILMSGCDDAATQIAREAADRQAQQNTAMAKLNQEVASGTHQLVAADAEARKEIVVVHHDLQAERSKLDTSWNSLEDERREIAGQRRTESWLSSMTTIIGGVLLTAMLLGFCWHAVFAATHTIRTPNSTSCSWPRSSLTSRSLGIGGSPALLTRAGPEVGERVDLTPSL